jgi:secondary thiamine-phosphate synthase enzyme
MAVKIINEVLKVDTKASGDLVNITDDIAGILKGCALTKGSLTVFVVGSTAAITTFEFEPGLIQDIKELFEKKAPSNKNYLHDQTWGDANGFSHVRASLQGPSLTIPFEEGKLLLGTWQQVVLAEFDTRPRHRQVIINIVGQ